MSGSDSSAKPQVRRRRQHRRRHEGLRHAPLFKRMLERAAHPGLERFRQKEIRLSPRASALLSRILAALEDGIIRNVAKGRKRSRRPTLQPTTVERAVEIALGSGPLAESVASFAQLSVDRASQPPTPQA